MGFVGAYFDTYLPTNYIGTATNYCATLMVQSGN